jgi:hemerythrin-like domain-containing protein
LHARPDEPGPEQPDCRAWLQRPAGRGVLKSRRHATMKITEVLFAEHMVFHSMFDEIETRVAGLRALGEVKAMAALMESMLKAHSDTEDELFLGPLEHCFEQIGQRDSFLEEHQEVSENLRLVQRATRIKQAKDLLLAAVAHSRRHFDREERIVFPLAERVLKSATLNELGQNWMNQRNRVANV